MTGAQALVRQLRSEGVETVFALPGVQVMAALDAFHEVQGDIRLVNTRHEQATTYMADGYAKVTGKVGVALVVPGPGALNAAAGLGTAYATSSPVLLIAGQIPSNTLGKRRGELHEIEDQLDVFRPITKWNHRVTRVEEVPEAVHEAMRQLKTGRPRPVELEVPPDTLAVAATVDLVEPEDYPRQAPDPADIDRAARLLTEAQKPAIIAGGGTVTSAASAELLELAEHLQAPVMTTQQAKGILPEDHYLAVGTRFLISDLDIVDSKRIIHIDADPDEIGRNHPTEIGIEADARTALAALLQRLRAAGPPKESRRQEIGGYKRAFAQEVRDLAPRQTGIVDSIQDRLEDDAVVVVGITNIGYWSNLAYQAKRPRSFITTSYFATLGFAFPTALGAKVAAPDRQVVALCGDGGFLCSPQELATATKYGINMVALVFNNGAYGASEWDQTHRYGGRYIGTDLHNPDFVKLAESFGAVGIRTDPEGLSECLTEALAANAPVVLEVEVPNMMPPFQIIR